MYTKLIAAISAFALALSISPAQEASEDLMQQSVKFTTKITTTVSADYLLYLPKGYDPKDTKRWPLMLFLHGAGERGSELKKVAVHGPPKLVKNGRDFPFILVSPQCASGERWSDDTLLALLDDITRKHNVDTNRVYLTGLSMGGYGTWSLAVKYPERFAAIAPICGGGQTIDILLSSRTKAASLKALPVWAFHGAKDQVVPLEESERMVAALKKIGLKEVELTVYPESNHDSWSETYQNEKLYDWFLKHERK